ncbi:MAG: hypothetical protein K2X39_00985, partial [Silvanigrellaceae bacterium]|nr:hypothetical protein [Silvanigrellaceae bacterium]
NYKYIDQCIDPLRHIAVTVPLVINQERIEYLKKNRYIIQTPQKYIYQGFKKTQKIDAFEFAIIPYQNFNNILYELKNVSTDLINFFGNYKLEFDILKEKISGIKENGHIVLYRQKISLNFTAEANSFWQPVLVMANAPPPPLKKIKTNNSYLPITADYDVFAIIPHLSFFSTDFKEAKNQIRSRSMDGFSENNVRLQALKMTIKKSLGQRERRIFHDDLGTLTSLHQETMDILNSAAKECGYLGGNVVHHGTEVDNTVVPNLDFPITAFTPAGRILSFENKDELIRLFNEMRILGYVVYENRSWIDLNFRKILKKLTGKTVSNLTQSHNNTNQIIWSSRVWDSKDFQDYNIRFLSVEENLQKL